ncbi:MAG: peptidase S58 family protein [Chloroflexi bacterium]|nr:peptidase S58 family protein [Chloroflexota bacterium]MDL1885701.1 P1 family peptidase [Anaerolineae bacterium CFX8]
MNDTLTDVPGILVGHYTHPEAATGCTVVICPDGTIGGVDQRGGAPGTRETDLLRPLHLVNTVNAVVLSGGSAYGLAAADGVMRYLEAHNIGYRSRAGYLVPIVPAAIVFDLAVGSADVRPDAAMGYAACEAASAGPVPQGTIGAGTGCRVGAIYGNVYATKGGIGSASVDLGDGLVVAALIVVNAVGDVVEDDGTILAGVRKTPDGSAFAGMMNVMKQLAHLESSLPQPEGENTVIGVVATNARLSKEETNKAAQMAQDGLARAVRPAHTMFDGDTIFAVATGAIPANVSAIGAYAAEVVARAIRNGVRAATSLAGVRAWKD